jgi:MFS family permease
MILPSNRNNAEVTYHRFITGIAVGIASTVNPLYVSENAPRGIRGLLTGFYQLSIVTGLTVNSAYKFALNLTNRL